MRDQRYVDVRGQDRYSETSSAPAARLIFHRETDGTGRMASPAPHMQ
jgi:hypothetical protein